MIGCAQDFASEAKHVKRVCMTNRNAATIAAMLDACRAKFGAACIKEDESKKAAEKVLTTEKGVYVCMFVCLCGYVCVCVCVCVYQRR